MPECYYPALDALAAPTTTCSEDATLEPWQIGKLIFVSVFAVYGTYKWWESGFWLPRSLHIFAALAALLGLALALMARHSGHPQADLHQWMIVAFPLCVYAIFVAYAGATGYIRQIGDHLAYHARMDKQEVLSIFPDALAPLQNLPANEILALNRTTRRVHNPEVKTPYWLFLSANTIRLDGESLIALDIWLDDDPRGQSRVLRAYAEMTYSLDGELLASPLEDIERIRK